MQYRADIDGLRAVAVVPVVLYHANVPAFSGGFTGVDIFFVISGFLITSIIVSEIDQGRFSIANFYERRIRRIFPALFAVLIVSCLLAIWLLLPSQFEIFAQSVAATSLFASNILFWSETGYFAAPASENPLLHTWSLAVEEQFYVIFPLLLLAIHRWFGGRWAVWLILFAIGSFILSAVGVIYKPSATFYLAPTRAWELLIGSLLAIRAVPEIRSKLILEVLALLGIGLIAWGVFGLSSDQPFPGLNALFPCLGTALIIYAGQSSPTTIGKFLGSKVPVFIGLISYSLYLWHWPLLVFGQMWAVYEPTAGQTALIVMLSFLAAYVSWKYVEAPFRRKDAVFRRKGLFTAAAGLTVLCVAFGLYGTVSQGWPDRISAKSIAIAAYTQSHNPRRLDCLVFPGNPVEEPCVYGAKIEPRYAVWGDSHADSTIHAIGKIAERNKQSALFIGSAGCPPIVGVKVATFDCVEENEASLRRLVESDTIQTVILVARWAVYTEGRARALGPAERSDKTPVLFTDLNGSVLNRAERLAAFERGLNQTITSLESAGKSVVLVYPIPEVGYDVPTTLAKLEASGRSASDFVRPIELFWGRQRAVLEVLDRIAEKKTLPRIYPHKALCNNGQCLTYRSGKPLYRDDDHLSIPGAETIAPLFDPIFQAETTQR